MSAVQVRRTGARGWPWETRCGACREERIHLTDAGAVAVNTHGVGNRLWGLAMLAAWAHLEWHRTALYLRAEANRTERSAAGGDAGAPVPAGVDLGISRSGDSDGRAGEGESGQGEGDAATDHAGNRTTDDDDFVDPLGW